MALLIAVLGLFFELLAEASNDVIDSSDAIMAKAHAKWDARKRKHDNQSDAERLWK